jgi:transposase
MCFCSPSPSVPDPALNEVFADCAAVPKVVASRADFFVFFSRGVLPRLEQHRTRLDALYCRDNGRPAYDPVMLLGALILQFVQRLPDRQAAESMQYDTRWRLALHLQPGQCACDPSLFSVFRERLLTGELEQLVFKSVITLLIEDGWLPRRSKQRLDSTHVCGLLSQMSRLECQREAIRIVLVGLEALGIFPDEWTGLWERYVETKVDPRSSSGALRELDRKCGEDMRTILAWTDACTPPPPVGHITVLRRILDENFETAPEGTLQRRHARPAGAVQNPHEPGAQWSSKSTTPDGEWIGYKTQVAETVQETPRERGEPTASFITAITTQEATASDLPGLTQVLAEQKSMGLEPPPVLYADGGYVKVPTLLETAAQGIELHGPAPLPPDRGKTSTVEEFDVDIAGRCARCPAGNQSSQCSRLEQKANGQVSYRFEWSNKVCQACPLFAQCVTQGQTHRTVCVGEHHGLLQTRRREMKTDAFKKDMRARNAIEGTHSELVRAHGLRKARYRGFRKVRLQNYLIGAACNLRRLHRRITWLAARGQTTASSSQNN